MITKERLEQIGRNIMATAITPSGYSSKFNELRAIKTYLQETIINQLSPKEMQDIVFSTRNNDIIEKLILIGKNCYNQNTTDERLYMVAMSIGTIIKEYGWGTEFVSGEGLCRIANKII